MRDIYNQRYKQYAKAAQARNFTFSLDLQSFEKLLVSPCKYCGKTPESEDTLNGIDRIDNRIGYEIDNVVSCCSTCNWAKRTTDVKDFIDWVHKVSDFQTKYTIPVIQNNQLETIDLEQKLNEYAKALILSQAKKVISKKALAKSLAITDRQLRYLIQKHNLDIAKED